MKAFIVCLLIISLIYKGELFSQNKKYNKVLPLLIIKNKQFDSIVSNAIYHLKKCDNYNKAIVYSVVIAKKNQSTYIDLVANYDIKDALTDEYWKPYGYFIHNNHLAFVFCDTLPEIFKVTKKKKMFVINDTIDFIFTAEYTEWLYLYHDNIFTLKKVINECNKKITK